MSCITPFFHSSVFFHAPSCQTVINYSYCAFVQPFCLGRLTTVYWTMSSFPHIFFSCFFFFVIIFIKYKANYKKLCGNDDIVQYTVVSRPMLVFCHGESFHGSRGFAAHLVSPLTHSSSGGCRVGQPSSMREKDPGCTPKTTITLTSYTQRGVACRQDMWLWTTRMSKTWYLVLAC